MWWGRVAAIAALLALGACGFEPLYGRSGGNNLANDLAGVAIQPIPDRLGQELRNYLIDRTGSRTNRAATRYRLEISLAENRADLGVLRDNSSSYARMTLSAGYALVDARTGQAVFRDRAQAINSYNLNLLEGGYSTLVAESDARDRAIRLLGDEILTRVSIHLRRAQAG